MLASNMKYIKLHTEVSKLQNLLLLIFNHGLNAHHVYLAKATDMHSSQRTICIVTSASVPASYYFIKLVSL